MMDYYTFNANKSVEFVSGGVFSAQAGWKHESRCHKGDYEIILCTKGPVFIRVATAHYELNKGDLLLVPPFKRLVGTSPSPNAISFYWLHFLLPDEVSIYRHESLAQLPVNFSNPDKIIIPASMAFTQYDQNTVLIYQLLSIKNTESKTINNIYKRQEANYLMTMILLNISQALLNSSDSSNLSSLIGKLQEWIRSNLYRSPTVSEMAATVHLNPQYLSRLFKAKVGIPPKKYVIKLKIETAQSLLLRTNMSIKEVSQNAYFENEKLFMKQFKNNTGMTPTRYRNQFNDIYHNNQEISPIIPIPNRISQKIDDIPDELKVEHPHLE